jgi:hypothetical protein
VDWLKTWFNKPAPVIIVSGLPRSGTSLMMQMLSAGGLPLLTDSHRQPDESNPLGYYEYAPVKRMHVGETAWLSQASGRGVKIVSALLPTLPANITARVIFMQRDLDEVVRSQRAMLERLNKPTQTFDAESLRAEYAAHLSAVRAWLKSRTNLQYLDISYTDLVCAPAEHTPRVATFLGGKLNPAAMAAAVDPSLYRERV